MALPGFWETGAGISFFSLLLLKTIATKLLHVKAMRKEDKRSRSTTEDGVFSLETLEVFFWEGTKI